ncbi:hypothetical protein PAPYR_9570 [Paratrimastix pyriformis]|uniref:Uncharacterized protein n=1 Tax=Paratrimastix pyriformis TaxID=342808 RepID=A0ABQ8UF87_9EUKA|nr:hypothetical protein PAPYR_9570 [Paratrimastix pyriformis]
MRFYVPRTTHSASACSWCSNIHSVAARTIAPPRVGAADNAGSPIAAGVPFPPNLPCFLTPVFSSKQPPNRNSPACQLEDSGVPSPQGGGPVGWPAPCVEPAPSQTRLGNDGGHMALIAHEMIFLSADSPTMRRLLDGRFSWLGNPGVEGQALSLGGQAIHDQDGRYRSMVLANGQVMREEIKTSILTTPDYCYSDYDYDDFDNVRSFTEFCPYCTHPWRTCIARRNWYDSWLFMQQPTPYLSYAILLATAPEALIHIPTTPRPKIEYEGRLPVSLLREAMRERHQERIRSHGPPIGAIPGNPFNSLGKGDMPMPPADGQDDEAVPHHHHRYHLPADDPRKPERDPAAPDSEGSALETPKAGVQSDPEPESVAPVMCEYPVGYPLEPAPQAEPGPRFRRFTARHRRVRTPEEGDAAWEGDAAEQKPGTAPPAASLPTELVGLVVLMLPLKTQLRLLQVWFRKGEWCGGFCRRP